MVNFNQPSTFAVFPVCPYPSPLPSFNPLLSQMSTYVRPPRAPLATVCFPLPPAAHSSVEQKKVSQFKKKEAKT